jgi:uncharacterized protein (TIRG00374 family)
MMLRRILRLLPWLIGIALLILAVRAVSLADIVATVKRLQLWQLGVLVVANAFVLVTITGRWWMLLRGIGHIVPFTSLFAYRLAAFGLSYFTPGPHVGGEVLQVLLVEKEFAVPRSDSLAAVALDKAIEFSVNLAFLMAGILFVLQRRILAQEIGQQILLVAGSLLALPLLYLGMTALGYLPATRLLQQVSRRWPRFSSSVKTVSDSEAQVGRYYRRAPRSFLAAVAITVVGWAVLVAEYWLMVRFLGATLTFTQLVATLTAARISILLFLPAGLGALEASQTMAFGLLGLDPAVGISASLLIRLRDTLLGLFGIWWWTSRYLGGRRAAPDLVEPLKLRFPRNVDREPTDPPA